jgi:uncharacterized protein (DUF4415 family)
MSDWTDPDDAPMLTKEFFEHGEVRVGDKVIRPATGYLATDGVRLGRPPLGEQTKRQVTLRLDPDVIARFREGGPGWQGRINAVLRKAVGLG